MIQMFSSARFSFVKRKVSVTVISSPSSIKKFRVLLKNVEYSTLLFFANFILLGGDNEIIEEQKKDWIFIVI